MPRWGIDCQFRRKCQITGGMPGGVGGGGGEVMYVCMILCSKARHFTFILPLSASIHLSSEISKKDLTSLILHVASHKLQQKNEMVWNGKGHIPSLSQSITKDLATQNCRKLHVLTLSGHLLT